MDLIGIFYEDKDYKIHVLMLYKHKVRAQPQKVVRCLNFVKNNPAKLLGRNRTHLNMLLFLSDKKSTLNG